MAGRFVLVLLTSVGVVQAQGTSVCAQWCKDNFPNPGSTCTSLAAQGKGPCYECGPPVSATSPNKQLCAGVCTDTNTDNANCGSCGNACTSEQFCSLGVCKPKIPGCSNPFSCGTSTTSASTTSSAPPTVITCELGTAIGWQEGDSVTLDTQSGNGCNRWGWYETPTLAELQSGISGILYVGAGGNNIANAIEVGDWTVIASPTGGVTVTYSLDPGYFIDEAHIDLDCLPIDSCAPVQYTFNSGALPNLPVYSNPTPLQYPTCSGGSQAYLIIHGSINYLTTATTCEPPVAT